MSDEVTIFDILEQEQDKREAESKARRIEGKAREYAVAIYCLRAAAVPLHKPVDAKKTYAAALEAGRGLAACEAEAEGA